MTPADDPLSGLERFRSYLLLLARRQVGERAGRLEASDVVQKTLLEAWRAGAGEALAGPGPVVIWLQVEGRLGQKTPRPPRPMAEQIARLQQALGV